MPITVGMKLKVAALTVASAVAIAGFSGSAASAQSSGDGGPPKTLAQCKKRVKEVDKALVWENNRYAKEVAKNSKKRAAQEKKAASIGAAQAAIELRMGEIEAAIENEATSPEDGAALSAEWESLNPIQAQNARDLQTIADTLEGLEWELTEAAKLHKGNVRSTLKYRKQVAAYCKKLKK